MKLLFVDETDRQEQATTRTFFCICGLTIDEEQVISASNALEDIKTKYGLTNLKESRKAGLSKATKLALTNEVFEVLTNHEVSVVGIILGEHTMNAKLPKEDMYMGAISFLVERFTLSLTKADTNGLVVFDGMDHKTQGKLQKSFYKHIREGDVRMYWEAKPRCVYKERILPTLLFTDDDQSVLVQAVDLIATSLNSAIVNTTKPGSVIVIDDLPKGNEFLAIYWPLFESNRAGKVAGWGIKNWD